jgi:hypothetical protein
MMNRPEGLVWKEVGNKVPEKMHCVSIMQANLFILLREISLSLLKSHGINM